MIDTLGLNVPTFEGSIGHIRCFAHVVNLVTKSMLCQFNVPKAQATQEIADEDCALYELESEGADKSEGADVPLAEAGDVVNPPSALDVNDEDGWVDEIAAMTNEERVMFQVQAHQLEHDFAACLEEACHRGWVARESYAEGCGDTVEFDL